MRFGKRAIRAAWAIGLAAAEMGLAQSREPDYKLVETSTGYRIESAIPAPLVVSVRQRGPGNRILASENVLVPESGTATTSLRGKVEVERADIVHLSMTSNESLNQCVVAALGQQSAVDFRLNVAELSRGSRSLDRLSSEEVRGEKNVVAQMAGIRLRENLARARFELDDPVKKELRAQKLDRYLSETRMSAQEPDPGAYRELERQVQMEERLEAVNALASSVGGLAEHFSALTRYKLDRLREETEMLKTLVQASEEFKRALAEQLKQVQAEVKAEQQFQEALAKAHDRLDTTAYRGKAIQPRRIVTSACGQPYATLDTLIVEADAPVELAALRGEIEFDQGGRSAVLLRRVEGTRIWNASFTWPTKAKSLKLRVGLPGQGAMVGVPGGLTYSKHSLADLANASKQDLERIKKRYHSTRFRAEGGDEAKVMMIP